MGLLQPAKNQMAYLKMGIFGFQGSGKSYTSMKVAIGLHEYIKSNKPVAYFDTETGSDFLLPHFQKAGIELLTVKSRAFKDLCDTVKEAEQAVEILIVDSITHPWREFLKAYKAKGKRKFLRIQDWGPIKEGWSDYSELYINSKLHIIMCGRAGNIFEDIKEDEDDGKSSWKAVKVGTKMSAETELGYEPSLLVELEKVYLQEGGKYARKCNVIKDRFDIIDSAEFYNPTFDSFFPHVELLAINGNHFGIDGQRTSESLFDDNGRSSYHQDQKRKEIALDEIQSELSKYFPSSGAIDKAAKVAIVEAVFNSVSWSAIKENMHPELCVKAREEIRALLASEELDNALSASSPDKRVESLREILKNREILNERITVGCPNKDDMPVYVSHCNNTCKSREGCPSFPDD